MKRNLKCMLSLLLCLVMLFSGCAAKRAAQPIAIAVWHYYNGAQKRAFDELVAEFNDTIGAEKGIVVMAYNQGSINELSEKVIDAMNRTVGAAEAPDVFAAYADTAYAIYLMGLTAELEAYLTPEEQAAYVPSYLSEGMFSENAHLTLIPVAKSTEIFMLNATDWEPFAAETGASEESFATWEGIAKVAEAYYRWTDAKTETPGDGKAFFGRDAMANYQIIGSLQLGAELFDVKDGKVTLNINQDAFRRLWDNYYIPYINGYYTSIGRFRSDDAKTGDIIALVGSTTGATFFPTEVTTLGGDTYPIEVRVFPLPNFVGAESCAVQQGAGMAVTKSTPEREAAAMEFLKWFTAPDQNLNYCLETGYLPVQTAANSPDSLALAMAGQEPGMLSHAMRAAVTTGGQIVGSYRLYTNKAFQNGNAARQVVDLSMEERAKADRQAVLALMADGVPQEAAVARFATDENFLDWFAEFSAALHASIAD